MVRFLLSIFFLVSACIISVAQDDSTKMIHRIGVDMRPAVPSRHHDFLCGANPSGKAMRFSSSVHVKYAFSFPLSSQISTILPSAYQGVGLSTYSFFNHADIGTPIALYIFQGAEITRLSDKLSLDYEWNFGVSAGWHTNEAVSTKFNAYINSALLLSWHTTQNWIVSLGLDLTHFSNGDTTLPNAGINSIGARIGAVRTFDTTIKTKEHSYIEPSVKHWYLDLIASGALNAEVLTYQNKEYKIDGKFGVLALHVNPLYHWKRNLLFGPSIDIQYNEGVNLINHVAGVNPATDVIKFHRPPLSEQVAAGVSLRAEFQAPIFAINFGLGHNILYKGTELGGLYNIVALKAFISNAMFAHIGLKVSYTSSSNNLLVGLGWRFGR